MGCPSKLCLGGGVRTKRQGTNGILSKSGGHTRSTEGFVNSFLEDTGIVVDWDLGEAVWRSAGRAFRAYAERRRRQREAGTRRILADFLIGAHAATRGFRLLTLDERLYRTSFPALTIETV
jgi:hypothetical protein